MRQNWFDSMEKSEKIIIGLNSTGHLKIELVQGRRIQFILR